MQRPDFKKTDDMFNRVLIRSDIAVICLFENIETGARHVIANAHICWDPKYSDVKLVQAALLVDEVEKVANNFAKYPPRLPSEGSSMKPPPTYSDGTKIPIIISGDYNSGPGSGVYEFLTNGVLPGDHPDFLSHSYGRYTGDGLRHRLGLKSAYAGIGELPLTNYTPSFHGAIDYIWYSTATLSVNAVLSEVDRGYLEKVVGFPDAHNPSEYVLSFLSKYVSRLTASVTSPSSASSASNRRATHKRDRRRFFRARLTHDLHSHLPPLPGSAPTCT
jgi:CCR4-NOT transcription complex subunit 6